MNKQQTDNQGRSNDWTQTKREPTNQAEKQGFGKQTIQFRKTMGGKSSATEKEKPKMHYK